MGMARRSLILGGAATVAAFGISHAICGRTETAIALPLERLDVALSDIPFAERVSASYRRLKTEDELLTELLSDETLCAALRLDCPAQRQKSLREHARRQFEIGNYCVADRLVVANSERLIAALRLQVT